MAEPVGDRITYVGHATALIEVGGARVLTDPVLRDRVVHLRRMQPVPDGLELEQPDLILVSHAHADHLDKPTLRRLAPGSDVVVPRGAAGLLRRSGANRVIELSSGEEADVAGIRVTATPAEHDNRRWPWGRRIESIGYLIDVAPRRVYFAGDTDFFPGMEELAGGIDLALIPVAGWGPKVGDGHLDPEDAAEAVRLLEPRMAVPIHWGTFTTRWGPPTSYESYAHRFAELCAAQGGSEAVVLQPGEGAELPAG